MSTIISITDNLGVHSILMTNFYRQQHCMRSMKLSTLNFDIILFNHSLQYPMIEAAVMLELSLSTSELIIKYYKSHCIIFTACTTTENNYKFGKLKYSVLSMF